MADTRQHWLIPDAPYESYAAYQSHTGHDAVAKAHNLDPDAVLDEIHASGLRGRGGAGFPTGTKWASVKNHPCDIRYIVCNAAEGEPGTFKDRWLLRHNPYAVIEGMLIAGRVVGSRRLYIAIKHSFHEEIARLNRAIEQMRDSIGDCSIEVVEGPEEYLFGEEKALLEVIEGNEPLPREAHYPPYERGLFASPGSPNPAVVNNAETFAHVPSIVRAGAASFRMQGTADTPGTVLYTISGDVARPGIYEREAGIPLRELIDDVAGGVPDGRKVKVVLSGVAAKPITPDKLDTRTDFGSMHLIGSGLGSAGFVVYDDRTWIPSLARAVARFLFVESCNQCSACKSGLRTASQAIDELFDPATATTDDYPRALYGARAAPQGNRCYLPVQGSVVIPSLMTGFASEFEHQLANPTEHGDPIPIPKLEDFVPGRGFALDEHQAAKTPDWTYETAPIPESVRVPPDLAARLAERAGDRSVDELVRLALELWLDGS
jgi:NADH:ubiquinone oxidoreductase subunit F (NADH-binding)